MANVRAVQITIEATVVAGQIQSLRGSAWFQLSAEENTEYSKTGTVDVTDLLAAPNKTLGTLRSELQQRIAAQV